MAMFRSSESTCSAAVLLLSLAGLFLHHAPAEATMVAVDPTPVADDSLSQSYWADVDNQLAAVHSSVVTEAPVAPMPMDQIQVWDSIAADSSQPYLAAFGAKLLRAFSPRATASPPPSQAVVSAEFVAQCPMIMFGNEVRIREAVCGETMGQWLDPTTNRSVLRWANEGNGVLRYGVDSAVKGKGTETFARMAQQMRLTQNKFQLTNCKQMTRYYVEESITKLLKMGSGESTATGQDEPQTSTAFFLKYTIYAMSGTPIAATNLYRMNSDQVNVTFLDADGKVGENLAVATREGIWRGKDWMNCSLPLNEWRVEFQQSASEFALAATVMDLRVAAAALFTLMAVRDESRSQEDGLLTSGNVSTGWFIFEWIIIVVAVVVAGGCCCFGFHRMGFNTRCKRVCFRFEQAVLPRRALKSRVPIFMPTY